MLQSKGKQRSPSQRSESPQSSGSRSVARADESARDQFNLQRLQAAVKQNFSPESLLNVRAGAAPLPADIRAHHEAASGVSLHDAQVFRNSPIPERWSAEALTFRNRVFLGPGKERHLAHEAWHVVQQKRNAVHADFRIGGTGVNTSARFENEADRMGARAEAWRGAEVMPAEAAPRSGMRSAAASAGVVQGYFTYRGKRISDEKLDRVYNYLYVQSNDNKNEDEFKNMRASPDAHSLPEFLTRIRAGALLNDILENSGSDTLADSAPAIDLAESLSASASASSYGKAPSSSKRKQARIDTGPYDTSLARRSARKPPPSSVILAGASALRRHGLEFGDAINNRYGGTSMSVQLGPYASESVPGGQGGSAPNQKLCRQVEREILAGRSFIRGHLLNEKLGGSGDDIRNLTPLSSAANHAHSTLETILKDELNAAYRALEAETRQHRDVYTAIVIQYDVRVVLDDKNRPIGIIARAVRRTRRFMLVDRAAVFSDEIYDETPLFHQRILNDGTVKDLKDE